MPKVPVSSLSIRKREAAARSRPAGLRLALMTLRLLENWRSHLGLDHDSALIILATAAITMEKFTRLDFDAGHRDVRNPMPPELLTKCNVSSIAAATGMNRETARRKVQSLLSEGMLVTDDKGSIRLSPDYTRALQTDEMMSSQLQTLVQTANGLLKDDILEGTSEV
jgi:hypothetical protein